MSDYLLDTNIIIDYLRNDSRKVEYLEKLLQGGSLLHSCEITVAETFSGMYENERALTEEFISSLHYLTLGEKTARKAGEFRHSYRSKGKQLTLADALIASISIDNNLILLTDNLKDYPMPELQKMKP